MSYLDPVETLLAKLDGVKRTGKRQWQARCPAYDDAHASLSIARGEDGKRALAGIVLLFRTLGQSAVVDSELDIVGSSDIEHAVRQLENNYDILRRQATQGFVLAGTFMALGILVILAGSLGEMFGFAKVASNLITVAGVIVETVSGLGLYLFKETFKRLNSTSDKLYDMWKILAAFQKAETLPDEKKSEVIISLINKMV